jgi:hypothetical protein
MHFRRVTQLVSKMYKSTMTTFKTLSMQWISTYTMSIGITTILCKICPLDILMKLWFSIKQRSVTTCKELANSHHGNSQNVGLLDLLISRISSEE